MRSSLQAHRCSRRVFATPTSGAYFYLRGVACARDNIQSTRRNSKNGLPLHLRHFSTPKMVFSRLLKAVRFAVEKKKKKKTLLDDVISHSCAFDFLDKSVGCFYISKKEEGIPTRSRCVQVQISHTSERTINLEKQ
jgi:hypothetical protein